METTDVRCELQAGDHRCEMQAGDHRCETMETTDVRQWRPQT
ncbi:uncharacterized, partial [Tachysurus ichikawai]